jgi:hypothetical protein
MKKEDEPTPEMSYISNMLQTMNNIHHNIGIQKSLIKSGA